ncbi:MAG: TVP38/TMEM64 family protein [Clostridia bacterium]|nr:TVP38/TMEM64 family protein [Clostridia bacterium]
MNKGNVSQQSTDKRYILKRRIFAGVSIFLLVALSVWLTWFLWKKVGIFELEHISEFQARIDSFGAWGWLVALGIQVLQVIVALIPGEVVEVGCGLAFGTWGGLIICLLGSAIGATIIFLLVRKFGVKLVEVFVSREKINSLKFLNNERKLKSVIFLVFFTIGTPKDLLTYFAGLTNIKFHEFLIISTVARIPSILSSILVGDKLSEGNFVTSILIFGASAVLGLMGVLAYNKFVDKRQAYKEKKNNS